MKKITINVVVALALAFSVAGPGEAFSKETSNIQTQLRRDLESYDERDEQFLESFVQLTDRVARHYKPLREGLEAYKNIFNLPSDRDLIREIYAVRRFAHRESVYESLECFLSMSNETQTKVIEHFVLYGFIFFPFESVEFANLVKNVGFLADRKTCEFPSMSICAVRPSMPKAFHELIDALDPDETDKWLDCLYAMLLNTIKTREKLQAVARKD